MSEQLDRTNPRSRWHDTQGPGVRQSWACIPLTDAIYRERQARREAYAKVRAAVNEHADIRLPDGRLAIAREVAVLLIDTLMGDDDGR